MSATVTIKKGRYGNKQVVDKTFNLVKPYDATRGYITVWGDEFLLGNQPKRGCRVHVSSADDVAYSGTMPVHMEAAASASAEADEASLISAYMATESDEQAIARIKQTFDHLDKFAMAAAEGIIKGMIVVGAPGIGKSYGILSVMDQYNTVRKLNNQPEMCEVIKGTISAPYLYRKLYEFKDSNEVLVLDDCEIGDVESINMLKAALDTCGKRTISWYKESHWLEKDGLPDKFEYNGSCIMLTNAGMIDRKGATGQHLGAVVSRCHYLDLEINSIRDKVLRIKQVCRDGMIRSYKFGSDEEEKLMNFVTDNASLFLELSLRSVIKLCDLRKAFPSDWEEMATTSLMKKSAKYARLARAANQ